MTDVLEQPSQAPDIPALMDDLGMRARAALQTLSVSAGEQRDAALAAAAAAIRDDAASILAANALDMQEGRDRGLSTAMLDRLMLDAKRIEAPAAGLDVIAALSLIHI